MTHSRNNGRPRTQGKRLDPELLDRQPPCDLVAERAVIGSVILDPTHRMDEVLAIVGGEHFYNPCNAILFDHLQKLHNNGGAVDVTLLTHSLKAAGELEQAGGAVYLAEVLQSVPVAAHAVYYAGIVKEKSDRRTLLRACERGLQLAHDDGSLQDVREELAELLDPEAGDRGLSYPAFTGPELDAQQYQTQFLVSGVLPQGHHCIMGGPQKVLKTLLVCDMAVALANGGRFLGYFDVPRAVRVAFMSGETGLPILQENLRRIAHAAGTELNRLDNLLVTDKLPRFGSLNHVAAMERFIRDNGLAVVAIDPAYLAMPCDDAGNVFAMGELLLGMAEVFVATGCTMLLSHHATKPSGLDGEPLDLNALSWAGFREFAAAWMLVSRRQRYEPGTGLHKLWLSVGGRAGHSGLFGIDVNEGIYQPNVERLWQVSVLKPEEARARVQNAKDQAKAENQAVRIEEGKRRIVGALVKFPDGETPRGIRIACGLNPTRFDPALAELIHDGSVVPCDIGKPNRKTPYEGYKLADDNPR